MEDIKVLVTGGFSAGKTQLIKTLTDDFVSTEKPITDNNEILYKENTTVAMDYGKINIDGKTVHLFGTPGQERFRFMWEVLDKNKSAFILLVDSTDIKKIKEAETFLDYFSKDNVPFVIGCNKQDLEGALSVQEIKNFLKVDADYIPLVATDKNNSMLVLKLLMKKIEKVLA